MAERDFDERIDEIARSGLPVDERIDAALSLVDETEQEMTLTQIGRILGCSAEQARCLVALALDASRRVPLGLPRRPRAEVLADRAFMDSIRVQAKRASDRDADVLRAIRGFDVADAESVAERLGVHESTVVESCGRLRARGLVRHVEGGWVAT